MRWPEAVAVLGLAAGVVVIAVVEPAMAREAVALLAGLVAYYVRRRGARGAGRRGGEDG